MIFPGTFLYTTYNCQITLGKYTAHLGSGSGKKPVSLDIPLCGPQPQHAGVHSTGRRTPCSQKSVVTPKSSIQKKMRLGSSHCPGDSAGAHLQTPVIPLLFQVPDWGSRIKMAQGFVLRALNKTQGDGLRLRMLRIKYLGSQFQRSPKRLQSSARDLEWGTNTGCMPI